MPIRVVGLNYRVASIEVRENFAMDSDAVSKTLLEWRESFPGIEAALLSTCNRTELYFASDLDVLPSYEEVFPFLVAPSRRHNNDITFDRYSDVLQTLEERDAAEQLHLGRVVARKGVGQSKESEIFFAGDAEVGMEQSGGGGKMQPSVMICSVKPARGEEPSCVRRNQPTRGHRRAGGDGGAMPEKFPFPGNITLCARVEFHDPVFKSIWQGFTFGASLACCRIVADERLGARTARTAAGAVKLRQHVLGLPCIEIHRIGRQNGEIKIVREQRFVVRRFVDERSHAGTADA